MMDYALDAGAGAGLRLGLIVLSTDETLEYEARALLGGRAANLMHTRIPAQPDVTPEQLRTMEVALPAAAGLLPQGLQAVGYGCTSASTVIGPKAVEAAVQAVHPGVAVTNPISAVLAGLGAVGARRIALVTPYVQSVTAEMRAYLGRQGIEVLSEVSFGQKDDWTVARITEASTRAAMLEAGRAPGVEAVFASCTNLRTFGVIDEVEAELGVPVISSNQALLWHMLRIAGAQAQGWGPGRLFHQREALCETTI
jgi:maleate isomerase